MPSLRLAGAVAALLIVALGGSRPAQADTVLANNGDRLTGTVQLGEVPLTTGGGVVRVAPRDVWRVTLGTLGGDRVELRNGRTLSGLVELASYTVRLPSGQSIVLERNHVGQLLLRGP